jgi:hypothetical protein
MEGIIQLPRPPPPPFDIDTTEPVEPPWQAVKEWIPDDEPDLDWFKKHRLNQRNTFIPNHLETFDFSDL